MLTDSDWVEDDTAFRWAAKRMTESSRQHAAEVTSFEQLSLAQVAGIVDASAKVIGDAFIEIAAAQGVASSVQLDADISRLHRNAVYNLIRLGKAGTGLPQIQIEAGVTNRSRKGRLIGTGGAPRSVSKRTVLPVLQNIQSLRFTLFHRAAQLVWPHARRRSAATADGQSRNPAEL